MVRNTQGGFKASGQGNSLVTRWLRLSTLTAEGLGLIPGQETKIPQTLRLSHKNRQKTPPQVRGTGTGSQQWDRAEKAQPASQELRSRQCEGAGASPWEKMTFGCDLGSRD